jgi:anti-sigma B factor antagonist
MKMTTSTRQVGGITIVDISGRIELGEESAAVRDLVCDVVSKGQKQILLNLGDVHYIDSSGLGALVSAFTSVRKQGGELKLVNLTDKVTDLMQITKLYTVFDIMNDEAVAVKSFRQSAGATA